MKLQSLALPNRQAQQTRMRTKRSDRKRESSLRRILPYVRLLLLSQCKITYQGEPFVRERQMWRGTLAADRLAPNSSFRLRLMEFSGGPVNQLFVSRLKLPGSAHKSELKISSQKLENQQLRKEIDAHAQPGECDYPANNPQYDADADISSCSEDPRRRREYCMYVKHCSERIHQGWHSLPVPIILFKIRNTLLVTPNLRDLS